MRIFASLLAGLLVTSVIGAAANAADSKQITIGAIYLDTQGYYAGVRAGVQDRAAEIGAQVNVIETNARGDVAKESSFINTIAAAGVNALIMSAVSTDGSVKAVERAKQAGIPVICYNTCVNDAAMKQNVFAYAVGDPVEFGKKIGGAAAAYFKAKNIAAPKIGVVNCEQYEVCKDRRAGFEQALKDAGITDYQIVANQEGTELDKAISTGQQILSANPGIDALFGESGGATLGAVKAVENTGNTGKVVVFGSDMTTDIANELQKHDVLQAEVDISGITMGKLALDLAMKAINGEQLDNQVVQAPIDLYTSADDAAGWLKAHADGIP
jgi:simple sugar transport system substrate-binding protein